MKILNIKAVNFQPYGTDGIDINFNTANSFSLLTGVNGAGKSSIKDVIQFALFGKVVDKNLKDLPNRLNKKMLVEIDLIAKNKRINIQRGLEPKVFKVTVDGNSDFGEKAGQLSVQDILENELYGIPNNIFNNIISLSIDNFKSFLKMTNKDKIAIIDKVFGLSIINDMNVLLKDDIKTAVKEKNDITVKENLLNEQINNTANKIVNIKRELEESNSTEIEINLVKIEKLILEIDALDTTIDMLKKEIVIIVTELDELLLCENAYTKELSDVTLKYNEVYDIIKNVDIKISDYNKLLEKNKELLVDVNNEINKYDNEINIINNTISNNINDIKKNKEKIISIESFNSVDELDKLNISKSNSCEKLDDLNNKKTISYSNYIENLSKITNEILEYENELKLKLNNLDDLNNKNEDCSIKLNKFNILHTRIISEIENVSEKITLYENDKCPTCHSDLHSEEQSTRKEELYEQNKQLNSKKNNCEIKINEFTELKKTLIDEISVIKYDIEYQKRLIITHGKNKVDVETDYNNKVRGYDKEISDIEKSLGIIDIKIKNIDDTLANNKVEIENIKNYIQSIEEKNLELSSNIIDLQNKISDKQNDSDSVKNTITKIKTKIDDLSFSILNDKQNAEDLQNKIANLNKNHINTLNIITSKKDEKNVLENKIQSYNTDIVSLKNNIENIKQLNISLECGDNIKKEVLVLENIINDYRNDLHNTEKEIKKYDNKLYFYNILSDMLNENGIKQLAMNTIIPGINNHIKELLIDLDMPFSLEFDSEFDAKIKHMGQEVSQASLSTGENKKLELAVIISIIRLMKIKYPELNILFLDEILSNLDSVSVYKVLYLLKKTSVDFNMNVCIVNHAPIDSNIFDKIYYITKKNEFSTIELK